MMFIRPQTNRVAFLWLNVVGYVLVVGLARGLQKFRYFRTVSQT